jgi:hydroxymethylpyrimidine/phosphomethylpyrimidine kinase
MQTMADMPVAVTIGCSDSGAGDGIQADLLTMAANGVFGTTVVTSLAARNPDGISEWKSLPPDFVHSQIDQLHRYFSIAAVKTGFLCNAGIIEKVADFLEGNHSIQAVVDPVMSIEAGRAALDDAAVKALQLRLLPRAALITPNLDEAAVLLGNMPESIGEMSDAADQLACTIGVPVLLKGGHLKDAGEVADVLALPNGDPEVFTAKRIENINTYGSGCTLSSAITANLAKGWDLTKAVGEALTYLRRGMRQSLYLNGTPFIHH